MTYWCVARDEYTRKYRGSSNSTDANLEISLLTLAPYHLKDLAR